MITLTGTSFPYVQSIAGNGTTFCMTLTDATSTNFIGTSIDGLIWSINNIASCYLSYGQTITVKNNTFYTVLRDLDGNSNLSYSSNGITWSILSANIIINSDCLTWNDTKQLFFAQEGISSDGINWTTVIQPGNFLFIK